MYLCGAVVELFVALPFVQIVCLSLYTKCASISGYKCVYIVYGYIVAAQFAHYKLFSRPEIANGVWCSQNTLLFTISISNGNHSDTFEPSPPTNHPPVRCSFDETYIYIYIYLYIDIEYDYGKGDEDGVPQNELWSPLTRRTSEKRVVQTSHRRLFERQQTIYFVHRLCADYSAIDWTAPPLNPLQSSFRLLAILVVQQHIYIYSLCVHIRITAIHCQ